MRVGGGSGGIWGGGGGDGGDGGGGGGDGGEGGIITSTHEFQYELCWQMGAWPCKNWQRQPPARPESTFAMSQLAARAF